jgi:hypothetical protein
MLDPNIWTDEGFLELSVKARLLFIGLISHADDHGRGTASIRGLRARIFPGDGMADEEVESLKDEVQESVQCVFYQADGTEYYQLARWHDYQKVKMPRESVIPEPSEQTLRKRWGNGSPGVPQDNGRDSPAFPPNGKEGNRKGMESPTEQPKAGGEPAAVAGDSLHHQVQLAFEAKHGHLTDYGKEGKQIKRLIARAEKLFPDDPAAFLRDAMATFWRLKSSGEDFWRGQPFTPSALSAAGIWDRVTEQMRKRGPELEVSDEEIRRIMGHDR